MLFLLSVGARKFHRGNHRWFPQGFPRTDDEARIEEFDPGQPDGETDMTTDKAKRVMRAPTALTGNEQLPKGKRDDLLSDAVLPGLWLRLRAGSNGRTIRNWCIVYRVGRSSRRFVIGSADILSAKQARDQARKKLAEVVLGGDPQQKKAEERRQGSLREVVEFYIAAKTPVWRERTRRMQSGYLRGPHFKPLHLLPVAKIGRADVAACVTKITTAHSASIALRARAALSAMFVWALGEGLCEINPVVGTNVPGGGAKSRDRVLSDAELRAVWLAAGDDAYGSILKLLILTGCRRQEIGGMTREELDRDAGCWTLPPQRAKNGNELVLPLPAMAWEIIDRRPRLVGRDHLFGLSAAEGFTEWAGGKARLDERLGDSVKPFVIHDIRRTFSTKLNDDLEVEPHLVEALLNHTRKDVARVYNKAKYVAQKRTTLARWADHVRALVEGTERKVLAFEQRAEA
jgi:integrase